MVSFGKNKNNKSTARRRYRYDTNPEVDTEIADVLLREKTEAPLAVALVESENQKGDEVIYELVVEDKNSHSSESSNESSDTANLNEQVAQLCREYATINQQLEKSLAASTDLSKQLENSKKTVTAGYLALGLAGLAFLVGVGAVVVGASMQRDVDDLKNSLASVTAQVAVAKKESDLKKQQVDGQIVLLNEKIDKIFASDNLDSVLEVTKELRKQVHALASKNLAIMNSRNQVKTEPPKVNKILLPSLKVDTSKPSAVDKVVTPKTAEKVLPVVKADAEKKKQENKLPALNPSEVAELDSSWTVVFGTYKDKKLAKATASKLEKAGIEVETVSIKLKKHHGYRLVSKTFKNKQEAQNYADAVEKNLNIHAAVLTKTK